MTYQIGKDEKISDIVDKFDIPYPLIRRFNYFVEKEDAVYTGRKLTFPRVHVVQPGQTYESIGKLYNIHPLYLRELNPYIDRSANVIYPGQTIYLPAKEY